jgi:LysM repeat protein
MSHSLSLMLCVMTLLIVSCDEAGNKPYEEWETLELTKKDSLSALPLDTIQLSPVEVASDGEICFSLPQVNGEVVVTGVTFNATLKDGKVVDYTLTTSSKPSKKAAPAKKSENACSDCYIIQKGDTKTNLAARFGIKPSQIGNKNIIIGQKLIIND